MFRQMRKARNPEGGFTLVELLVVIVILGVLAAIVVFAVSGVSNKSKQASCNTDVNVVQTAEEANYRADQRVRHDSSARDGEVPSRRPQHHERVRDQRRRGNGRRDSRSPLLDPVIRKRDRRRENLRVLPPRRARRRSVGVQITRRNGRSTSAGYSVREIASSYSIRPAAIRCVSDVSSVCMPSLPPMVIWFRS